MTKSSISVAVLAVLGCAEPPADIPPSSLRFVAAVSDLGLQTSRLAEGKVLEDSIELTLEGELFAQPVMASPIRRELADRSTPVDASISDFSAFKADDGEWILENFAVEERPNIESLLQDDEVRARNRAAFGQAETKWIYGRARYVTDRVYELLFINYTTDPARGLVEAYVQEDEEWRRTNTLGADEQFDVVFAAYRTGGVTLVNAAGR